MIYTSDSKITIVKVIESDNSIVVCKLNGNICFYCLLDNDYSSHKLLTTNFCNVCSIQNNQSGEQLFIANDQNVLLFNRLNESSKKFRLCINTTICMCLVNELVWLKLLRLYRPNKWFRIEETIKAELDYIIDQPDAKLYSNGGGGELTIETVEPIVQSTSNSTHGLITMEFWKTENFFVCGDDKGFVNLFNIETNKLIDSLKLSEYPITSIQQYNHNIYCGTAKSNFYVCNLVTGSAPAAQVSEAEIRIMLVEKVDDLTTLNLFIHINPNFHGNDTILNLTHDGKLQIHGLRQNLTRFWCTAQIS